MRQRHDAGLVFLAKSLNCFCVYKRITSGDADPFSPLPAVDRLNSLDLKAPRVTACARLRPRNVYPENVL